MSDKTTQIIIKILQDGAIAETEGKQEESSLPEKKKEVSIPEKEELEGKSKDKKARILRKSVNELVGILLRDEADRVNINDLISKIISQLQQFRVSRKGGEEARNILPALYTKDIFNT